MKKLLDKIKGYENSDKIVYINNIYSYSYRKMTYAELIDKSDKLAYYLQKKLGDNKNPIVVYGHKHPMMLVYFLACAKSGRAFCPVDNNTPEERLLEIVNKVDCKLILTTENLNISKYHLNVEEIEEKISDISETISENYYVKDEDIFYIIFTSGSTGEPKGVCITYNNINSFLEWYTGYYKEDKDLVFLGHPPFSFDLSVMSLWPAVYMESKLVQIDKIIQSDFKKMFSEFQNSKADIWISTPSFIEMCFVDKNFNDSLLPDVKQFIFCGERLFSSTVKKIHENFPKAKVINTYGPTESTVMVTWMEITKEINEKFSANLPIGYVKKRSRVIIDDIGLEKNKGEMVIIGDTVAKGYFNNEEMTELRFSKGRLEDGREYRSYRTGDVGYYIDDMLFCEGRIDFQVKLHGYRIELEDIDNNLLKNDKIIQAATISNEKEGKVVSLTSYIVYSEEIDNRFKTVKSIKLELKQLLPDYMIPKKIVFLKEMPMNNNGKIDKKALRCL